MVPLAIVPRGVRLAFVLLRLTGGHLASGMARCPNAYSCFACGCVANNMALAAATPIVNYRRAAMFGQESVSGSPVHPSAAALFLNRGSNRNSGRCAKLLFAWTGIASAAPKSSFRVRSSAREDPVDFVNKIERVWLISKQPSPVCCTSCNAKGYVECKWCKATGFFIIGDNLLCEVPSRNSTCVICGGQGSVDCSDCKGTGFRAKWLEQPQLKVPES